MRFSLRALSLVATSFSCTRAAASVNASSFIVSAKGAIGRQSSTSTRSANAAASTDGITMADPLYPGTAVERMLNVRARVKELAEGDALNGTWDNVRRKILWAGGLKDLPNSVPGQGYTGHSFNDFNHVDLTCMLGDVSSNENDGAVPGIAIGNNLGEGIRIASLPELGPGGSWSTCANGCDQEPPQDVAHVQFRSRIAYKMVWAPPEFTTFVLVDDEGKLLAKGTPSDPSGLPAMRERQLNYRIVQGSKYASEADKISRNVAAE
jgi:hypothetical protein